MTAGSDLWRRLRSRRPADLAAAIGRRVFPKRFRSYASLRDLVAGRRGLEIGGPSSLFARSGPLPIYADAGHIDNCNFSATTVWQGAADEGMTFVFDRRHEAGRQYIREATDLAGVPTAHYAFLLSSHTIEHCANPLKALREWTRVLEDGGAMVLVVPHREGTFDHRRPVTTLEHLVDDLEHDTGEDDLSHVPEILASHDLSLDLPAGDLESFTRRSRRNVENRCLHHHVFDTRLVARMVDRAGLAIQTVEPTLPYHIVTVARKPRPGGAVDNRAFVGEDADYRRHSPFLSDRG